MAFGDDEKKKRQQQGLPPLPEGFVMVDGAQIPAPPAGFEIMQQPQNTLGGATGQALGGFNEVIASILSAPGEMVNPLFEQVAGRGRQILPSRQDIQQIPGLQPTAPPQTKLERGMRRGGEMTAETLATILPMTRLARAGALSPQAAMTATPKQQITSNILQQVGRSTASPQILAAEAASGFGAGVGEQIAAEASDDDPTAKFVGALAGGLTPATVISATRYMPTRFIYRGAKSVVTRFSPALRAEAAKKQVGELVGDLSAQQQENINRAAQLSGEIGGFSPSLGEASDAPAIVAQQMKLESGLSGTSLEREIARRQANIRAIGNFTERSAPKDLGENIEFVMDEANNKLLDIRSRIQISKTGVATKRKELASGIPKADKTALGQAFRDKVIERRREVAGDMNKLANDLGINDADVTVDAAEKFDDILASFQQGSFANREAIPDILNELAVVRAKIDDGATVTFQDLKSLRERVSDDLMDAVSGASPNRAKIRNLTQLKRQVDDSINTLTFDADPELAGRYKEFREIYFDQFISKFENNAVFRVRQKNQRAFFKTVDEKVADQFFSRGGVTDARQFKQIFKGDPEADQLMASVILDDLRDKVVKDGLIDPRAFNKWRNLHESVLVEFPEINKAISNVADTNDLMISRSGQLDNRMKVLESNALFKELHGASASVQAKTPEQALSRLMKDPRKMKSFMSIIKTNPAATSALKRHLWDGAVNVDAPQMLKYITTNEKALTTALGQKHVDNLKKIHEALIIAGRVPSPAGAGVPTNPFEAITQKALGVSPSEVQNVIYRYKIGFVNKRFALTQFAGKILQGKSTQAVEAALTEALYDPDVAALLATTSTAGKRASIEQVKKLNAFLLRIGVDPFEQDAEIEAPQIPRESQAAYLDRLNLPALPEGFEIQQQNN